MNETNKMSVVPQGDLPTSIEVVGGDVPGAAEVLVPEALALVADLQSRFGARRAELLAARAARQARLDAGEMPAFRVDTAEIRSGDWRVAPAPADFDDRRVEITGPAEAKMMINALNSGARCFMADIEDSLSPTWENVVGAQLAIRDAARRTLMFTSPEGKEYRLGEDPDALATLVVRPRGWHLDERHVLVNGEPVSASLFDFGLYMWHSAAELLRQGSGPYLYLPKLESSEEARLWNEAFVVAQEAVGIPQGSIRATVLIETILAAFEMDEILYELRDHSAGLNAGRWDYLFSAIKKFRTNSSMALPDRAQLTMTTPFMRAYTELLVKTCHRRGAHAIGGMAAFIPNRRDPEVTELAMAKVRADKERESSDGFDGTWVAHPDLVLLAAEIFDAVLGADANQKSRQRDDVAVSAAQLVDLHVPGGAVTVEGIRTNISVAVRYLDSWLRGVGAAAIDNLMEDAATAEISRSQLWQWRVTGTVLDDGATFDAERYRTIRDSVLADLPRDAAGDRVDEAVALLDRLVLDDAFAEFLTLDAYALLD